MLTPLTKIILKGKYIDIYHTFQIISDKFYKIIIFYYQVFCHTGRKGERYGDKADKEKEGES